MASGRRLLLVTDAQSVPRSLLALLAEELPTGRVEVVHDLDVALDRLSGTEYDGAVADVRRSGVDARGIVHTLRSAHPHKALSVLTSRADGGVELWTLHDVGLSPRGERSGPRPGLEGHHLLEAHESPTCVVDAVGTIVTTNAAWRGFTIAYDGRPESCGVGNNYLEVCDRATLAGADGLLAAGVADGLRGVLAGGQPRYQCEYPFHGPTSERWFSVRIVPAGFDGGVAAVISHVDVTEMYLIQQSLAHQTLHDVLTGLPNRLLLADRLTQALAQAERSATAVGVAFLDLDDFKGINDRYGHAAGDDLLVQLAQRLTRRKRAADTVSRYSGDEFVAIFGELASTAEALTLAEDLAGCLIEPFVLGATRVSMSASVGVSVGHMAEEADELLQAADAAMYDSKRHGCGRIQLYG